MSDNPSIYIVLLTFNGEKWLEPCMTTLMKTDYDNFHVVVVDNGSKDKSADYIAENFPEVTLIREAKNHGYAEGNNIGMRYCLNKGADFILLLNQDTKIHPNWLKEMIAVSKKHPEYSVLSPFQHDYEGKKLDQNFEKNLNDSGQTGDVVQFEKIIGAAIMFKREVLETVGLFDPHYFLYYEETDLCRRIVRFGYKMCAVRSSIIYHFHHLINEEKMSDFVKAYYFRNRMIYELKDPKRPLFRYLISYKFLEWHWRLMRRAYTPAETLWKMGGIIFSTPMLAFKRIQERKGHCYI